MNKFKLFLSFFAVLFIGLTCSFAELDAPLFSLELKSYEAFTADTNTIATAIGEDVSALEMQLESMLGPQMFELINQSEPWHVAVWMDSFEQPPIVAIVLPVSDFEAFEAAVQSSVIGAFGAQLSDAGERVILFGSSPGMPVAEGWAEKIQLYVEGLALAPTETVQVRLTLNDPIRQAIDAAMALPKAEMMSVFEDPAFEASGIPPETIEETMESYFAMYEALLRDLDNLEYGLSANDTALTFSIECDMLEGSESARFLNSQNVDISDLGSSASWNSDITVLMGLAAFPDDWQEKTQKLMESLMPLYGLSDAAAAEWTEATNMTLPFRGVYHMDFDGGMAFHGFYDILKTPAAEVYDKWLEISESAVGGEGSTASYYSDITIKRDHRSESGHPVDLMELTINPEHPTFQLPEQKAILEQMFEGGKINYEMSLVKDRIYVATEGRLDEAFTENTTTAPLEITADTRVAGSMNIVSMMEMGAEIAAEEMEIDFSELDSTGTQLLFKVDAGESLLFQCIVPLKLIEVFSELE